MRRPRASSFLKSHSFRISNHLALDLSVRKVRTEELFGRSPRSSAPALSAYWRVCLIPRGTSGALHFTNHLSGFPRCPAFRIGNGELPDKNCVLVPLLPRVSKWLLNGPWSFRNQRLLTSQPSPSGVSPKVKCPPSIGEGFSPATSWHDSQANVLADYLDTREVGLMNR